jgi:fumarate hydratase subunit beta
MMSGWKKIETPLSEAVLDSLASGDRLLLSGVMYTGRDQAHKRISAIAEQNGRLPVDLKGQIIYYTGPSPAPPGMVIGSAGPTTSARMDSLTEPVLKLGVKGMIGKGKRDRYTRELMAWYRAVYFGTFGGAGAYLAARVQESEVVAFEDLGPEAMFRLRVEDFPLIVINDMLGGDLYEDVLRKRQ